MSYTRNFEFRIPPVAENRLGRFISPASGTAIPIGAPVVYDAAPAAATVTAATALGLQAVKLAVGPQAPIPGLSGIAVFEYKGQDGWAGDDQNLVTYSDKDTVPAGKAVQVVSGRDVKVCFRNTDDSTFLNTRAYTGRTMVSEGAGSTPNIAVGDFLSPGAGTGALGFWAKTVVTADAWLIVTKVDSTRGEVEAQLYF